MKKSCLVLVLVLSCALALGVAGCGSAATTPKTAALVTTTTMVGSGGVQGKAYYAGTNEPIAAARLTLELTDKMDPNASTGEKTTTDAEGNYSFMNVLPGTYTLSFTVEADTAISGVQPTGDILGVAATINGKLADGRFGYEVMPVIEVPAGKVVNEGFVVTP
jgi:hypothetical protein